MKYIIFNLETNEYLSQNSHFIHNKEETFCTEWIQNTNFAKQMSYDESEDMYDYIKKYCPNLKIEIRPI